MVVNNSIAIFNEILAIDQRLRLRLSKALPKGMELSQFSVLNYLATVQGERTPAQISDALNVSRGAMTNTLSKLEARGDVNISPDWDDARRKLVSISPSGSAASAECRTENRTTGTVASRLRSRAMVCAVMT